MARPERHAGGEGLGAAVAQAAGRRAAAGLLRWAAAVLAVPLGKLLLVVAGALAALFLVLVIAAAAIGIAEADSGPSQAALAEIPPDYVPVLLQASRESGVPWQVLAALVKVESNFGRNNGPSPAGAVGPCQFLPATWAEYGIDGDGDGAADPWNFRDCIPATARYLVAHGAPGDLAGALLAYNHDEGYVRGVLLQAMAYGFRPWAAGLPAGLTGGFIPPTIGVITTFYGARDCLHPEGHTGLDIASGYGTLIWAPADGVVVHAATAPVGGLGIYVILDHGNGLRTTYGHLQEALVLPGQPVRQGEPIGLMGSTGYSTGPHLHLEAAVGSQRFDPLALIPELAAYPVQADGGC